MEDHPRALKVHPEHQTTGEAREPFKTQANLPFICKLETGEWGQREFTQEVTKIAQGKEREGKTFHTAERAFLKREEGIVTASVLKGRLNFKPSR